MALTAPGDGPVVGAAAAEFLKLCAARGLSVEQICQATIAAAASALRELHGGDRRAMEASLKNYARSLRSAAILEDTE